jgi:hypothetical protein
MHWTGKINLALATVVTLLGLAGAPSASEFQPTTSNREAVSRGRQRQQLSDNCCQCPIGQFHESQWRGAHSKNREEGYEKNII